MTTEERKSQLFAQPSAAKEVYRPDGHYLNGHIIVRGPDGLWHMYYAPMFPGSYGGLALGARGGVAEDVVAPCGDRGYSNRRVAA